MRAIVLLLQLTLLKCVCECKVLEIVKLGHPSLRSISNEFTKEEILSDQTKALAKDMIETMHAAKGVGLAGPQVDMNKRIFVAGVNNSEVNPPLPPTAFINPTLDYSLGYGKPKVNIFEGCLSLPGYRALVPRYETVIVTFNDESGAVKRIKATGCILPPAPRPSKYIYMTKHFFLLVCLCATFGCFIDIAGVIQHEYDHLNGVIYIDKMDGTTFCINEMCDKYFSSVVFKKGTWEYL